MSSFKMHTQVEFGTDALNALKQFAGRTVLLVTDKHLAAIPVFASVREYLGTAVKVFDAVLPNPTVAQIAQGVAVYLRVQPDVVVAFGGGSVIDAAKAIHKAALDAGRGAQCGLVAVPTTSGSGSEVTAFSVVTDETTHTKVPLVSHDLIPELAILDPAVVTGAPPHVTADSGMDVITHAIEAAVSNRANDFTDACAEKAVQLGAKYLLRCYRTGQDLDARSHMHHASCLAALAFDNAGLGITHSLAHALGGRYPIAHGRLNAMLLPHVIVFNASSDAHAASRYAALARLIGREAGSDRVGVLNLANVLRGLTSTLNIPTRLTDLGVPRGELRAAIPELAATALADPCTTTNPIYPTATELGTLLYAIG